MVKIGDKVRVAQWSRHAERGAPIGVVVRVLDWQAIVSFDGRERFLDVHTLEPAPTLHALAERVSVAHRERLARHGGDLKAARDEAVQEAFERR